MIQISVFLESVVDETHTRRTRHLERMCIYLSRAIWVLLVVAVVAVVAVVVVAMAVAKLNYKLRERLCIHHANVARQARPRPTPPPFF